MPQTLTAALTAHWSAETIIGNQFVGVLKDNPLAHRRVISSKEVIVDSGAITTAVGEAIDAPVGRPTLAL
jgi:hypothetical protein